MSDGFTVIERGAPSVARAFFICEKCLGRGKMLEPIELPVASRRCPLCGAAKHLSRIWAGPAPAVSTGMAKRIDGAMETQGQMQANQKSAAQRMPSFAVPMSQVAGMGLNLTAPAKVLPAMTDPVLNAARATRARPQVYGSDDNKAWRSTQ